MSWIQFFPTAGFIALIMLITIRILFLKQKGIQVSSATGKTGGKNGILYPVFLLILLVWFYELIKPAFGFTLSILPGILARPLIFSSILDFIGVILIIAAITVLILALLHFKQSLRFGLNKNTQGKLITNGIFSLSRNPFFLSLNLYFTGTAFIFPNLFFIGFAILAMAGIHFFILKEEQFLKEVYGEAYSRYSQKVNRYFGRN